MQEVEVVTFTAIPFPLEHDAAEPLGFLCYSRETGEKLLYFTDTYYIRNRFSGVTHIIGECNYDAETLWKAVEDGSTPAAAARRIFYSHMSLENLCDFLRANDLRRLRKIYVCHMSDRHGSEEKIKKEIGSAVAVKDSENIKLAIKGRSLIDGNPRDMEITQKHVAEALFDPVSSIANGVKEALEKTPPELVADIIDSGVTLTGGGALLANLDAFISRITGVTVKVAENPLNCVVMGTGKALAETKKSGSILLKTY